MHIHHPHSSFYSVYFYSVFHGDIGDIVFKTLKEFQAATKTTEILNEDIEFLSKYKRSKIIPTHCKIGEKRPAPPMTRKMIEETERKLLNCPIAKNYSKRWKQQRIKESKENFLQENLSLADYAKVLALTRKRNFKKLNYKNQHLSKKFEKMLKKVTKNHNTLSPTEKEEHQRKLY